MKKLLMIVLIVFSMAQLKSQNVVKEDRNFRMPLIGEVAPSFTSETTNGTINFPSEFGRKWKLLFSHPQDFTPVCTTEILELAYLQDQFDKLGVKVVVVSTSSIDQHQLWKKSMEGLNLNNKGTVKIKFPLVDDKSLSISKMYGMIHPSTNSTKAVRGIFIINPENIIQAIFFYPMSVGRGTDELLRTLTALQTTHDSKVMTPVNWKSGNDLLIPIPPESDAKNPGVVPAGFSSPVWYLWYKKAK